MRQIRKHQWLLLLAADGRHGHFIEDEGRRDCLPAQAVVPFNRHPVLAACRCAGDGDTAICALPHRRTGDDELLQLSRLVSYALLQQEEPTAMSEALNFHLAFGILNKVLDRRAWPDAPQGVAVCELPATVSRATNKGPDGMIRPARQGYRHPFPNTMRKPLLQCSWVAR